MLSALRYSTTCPMMPRPVAASMMVELRNPADRQKGYCYLRAFAKEPRLQAPVMVPAKCASSRRRMLSVEPSDDGMLLDCSAVAAVHVRQEFQRTARKTHVQC